MFITTQANVACPAPSVCGYSITTGSAPPMEFCRPSSSTLAHPQYGYGGGIYSMQHPTIQFATPFNSPLEGGIVEGVHCPALCESVHTFWAPSGYICNIENYAGLSCLLALLLLFVWTNFPTHLTCARPNTLLMLMTDGPKDDDDYTGWMDRDSYTNLRVTI